MSSASLASRSAAFSTGRGVNMTRAVRRNHLLKDHYDSSLSVGLPLSDHLRNHAHLTNCIHLKHHHMHQRRRHHRHSPVMSERSLMRDLIVLQRSRSLRDPSTSPPSWLSPSVAGAFAARRPARDGSVGVDRRREPGRLSTSSNRSRVAAAEVSEERNVDDDMPSKGGKEKKVVNSRFKTLSERLEEAPNQSDNQRQGGGGRFSNGFSRAKRRRFRGGRRFRGSVDAGAVGGQNGLSIDANSLAQEYAGKGQEEEDADADADAAQAPRNGCGIPWNWSRIHHRGKTILDIAGRSLSCGLSDSRGRKAEGRVLESEREGSRVPIASEYLSSSTDSDYEALPLLIEPSGSQESNGDPFMVRQYSGELGIFANNSSGQEQDSDLASEARSRNPQKFSGSRNGRHRSLTQKYTPKTFKDLVGQNLVAQALSNAVLRKKVGLIYVFYGPHGTGKTSCARVFAKALNCQSVEHPKPCDVCSSCISHNLGKNRNVLEVGPVSTTDNERMMNVLEKSMLSSLSSHYRVLIVDDCDTLPADAWSAISKVIDRAPRHVVFILVSSSLDHLPHIIISRCQKFFFPKLKDSDIVYTLQWISTSEGLEIDKDALKLIASRSDGSLRDAEMTLDQLSLLGQRISLPLVQELVGLVSDEKLVDLLDLALSADTVNTVKSLREIMESGVEPLALMSQLATIITDILAGSYVFTRERLRRKFFRRPNLSKEDMEKLRQALKTLSEAEKQLRVSNDKLTWLTAALLQLAPEQQYLLPSSSAGTSLNHSPMVDVPANSTYERDEVLSNDRGIPRRMGLGSHSNRGANDVVHGNNKMISSYVSGKRHVEHTPQTLMLSTEATKANGKHQYGSSHEDNEKIWRAILDNIQSDTLKKFMSREGKLNSVSLGSAPIVELMFTSPLNKSKAEKFRGHISQAFESVLHSVVTLEFKCEARKGVRPDIPYDTTASENGSQMTLKRESITNQRSHYSGFENFRRRFSKENAVNGIDPSQVDQFHSDMSKGEIIEIGASPKEHEQLGLTGSTARPNEKGLKSVWQEAASLQNQTILTPLSERRDSEEQRRSQSLVRSKVSLAHVIQQAEGCAQRGGWSRRKAVSIAEKLEQENLRLEPRSRSLLCWRAPRITQRKLPHLRIRTQPHSLLKVVTCGECLCARSSR